MGLSQQVSRCQERSQEGVGMAEGQLGFCSKGEWAQAPGVMVPTSEKARQPEPPSKARAALSKPSLRWQKTQHAGQGLMTRKQVPRVNFL